jgi:hypothetical protein
VTIGRTIIDLGDGSGMTAVTGVQWTGALCFASVRFVDADDRLDFESPLGWLIQFWGAGAHRPHSPPP